MDIVNQYRKIEFTVLAVDSIPCSLVGNRMVFSTSGKIETKEWKLPWAMPWIEEELRSLAIKGPNVSGIETIRVYNPEEPDQYVLVRMERYIDLTIGDLLEQISNKYPDKEALVSQDGRIRYSYDEFQNSSNQLANGLLCIGVEKDDKTAIWSINSVESVIAQFGISKIGSVAVPLNAHEKQIRMETLLKQSDATTLIIKAGTKNTESIDMLYRICPELKKCKPGQLSSEKLPMLKNVILIDDMNYPGVYTWSEILEMGTRAEDGALKRRAQQLHHDDTIHMIHTSGTTGTPKGVLLSHGNIIENALAMAKQMKLAPEDRMCVQAPLFHCFGCVACTVTSVIAGCSMVIIGRFRSNLTLNAIEREKCTVASGVPTMFLSFIDEMEKDIYDITPLRTGIIAGAPCPPELAEAIINTLGMDEIIMSYGLTETSPCITATETDDPLELKINTVGCAIPGVEIRIIDPVTHKPVKWGEQGEICARGYNVMKGYYKMPEETSKVIDQEGWLHTGDIGILREDGYLEMVCRWKDVIIRGGENISPKEIETYLGTHPNIAEVYVVGVPNDFYGEEVVAFIRRQTGSTLSGEDIKSYCKGKLASNKIPEYIIFVERFPLSATGKVLKKKLRQMAAGMKTQLGQEVYSNI